MSFDCLAPHYRWMERILAGEKLQICRTAFLDRIHNPARILSMGEGGGRFLHAIAEQFPDAEITVVDASETMLHRARQDCPSGKRILFIHADCLEWNAPSEHFDLIATHFFLDCFAPEELATVIQKLTASLRPDGAWLLSDFCVPDSGWRRWRAQWIHRLMYSFFRRTTHISACRVTPPDSLMHTSNLQLVERKYYDWKLLHADLWRKPHVMPAQL